MEKTVIQPPGHPPPRGAYSPAVKVDLGGAAMLFVTGQLALDAAGGVIAPGDAAAQSEHIFRLVGEILAAAGMGFGDIVRTQTYLTAMGDFENFSAVRGRYFGAHRPASTLLEVKGLAHPGCCVEVEVTAIK
jgi:2-iminobutanoate/2-iminopropanoate deaminase